MARKVRVHAPGLFYHVMARGNYGESIFHSEVARSRFLMLLQENMVKYGFKVHAYCLMTNHVHLLIQVGLEPLSRIMQNITSRYARWVNYTFNKTGHLFQGRYRAIIVDEDGYLMALVRYIHLNPIKANIISNIDEYQWSSHRNYTGEKSHWVTTEFILNCFSPDNQRAIENYKKFLSLSTLLNVDPEKFQKMLLEEE